MIFRMYPTAHFCADAYGTGYGTAAGQVAADCSTYVDEPYAALDETDYGYLRSSATAADYSGAGSRFEWTWGAGPTNVTIASVTLYAYMRTSNQGAATMDEPVRAKGFLNPTGTRRYMTGPTYVAVSKASNRNLDPAVGSFQLYTLGTWTVNPDSGTGWALADFAAGTFKAGIEAGGVAEGQAGNGVPPTTGGSSASWDVAQVWLELTTTPTSTFVEPMRVLASRKLRLVRSGLRRVSITLRPDAPAITPLQKCYLSHPFYPAADGGGAPETAPGAAQLLPLTVEDRLEPPTRVVEALDLSELGCQWWSPYRTDLGATDEHNGIARIDPGSGLPVVTRAQGGWVHRPGDYLMRDAASGVQRITPWGLRIEGGNYYWGNLDNVFSRGGPGTTFTSWTQTTAGTGAITESTSSYLLDVAGYRRSCVCTQGSPYAGNAAYVYQVWTGFLANYRVRVCIKFSMLTGSPGNVSFILRRSVDGKDWDVGNTWVAASFWNKCSDSGGSLYKVGSHYEYWSDDINVGAGATNLTLYVGYVQENSASVALHAASIVHNGTSTVLRREFLATTSAAIQQVGDAVDIVNSSTYCAWYAERGTVLVGFLPSWSHADLPDGATKYIISARHQVAAPLERESLYYERTNSTTGAWKFKRNRAGGASVTTASFATSAGAGTLPTYLTPVKLAVRWTSDKGELGLPNFTLSVFVNGVKGTDAAAAGWCVWNQADSYIALGRLESTTMGTSGTEDLFADGTLFDLEIRRRVLTDGEIARRHSQMGLNLGLPTVV